MVKKLIAVIITCAFLFTFLSCDDDDGVFSYCELRIPLTEDFAEVKNENFDVTYSNGNYAVAILRISFVAAVSDGIPETLSASEFGAVWLEKCEREANIINDGLVYCEYYDDANGEEYFYLESFYRSPYAYFVLLFATASELEAAGRVDFLKFANQVTFTT